MFEVILYGGTAEGRDIADALAAGGVPALAHVATDYGETLIHANASLQVHAGRLNGEEMAEEMRAAHCRLVIDATHPYASEVTKNIRAAAAQAGVRYLRVLRGRQSAGEGARFVESVAAAVDYLNTTTGNIFLATGSKDLASFTGIENYKERVFARVLSLPEVVASCAALGFQGKNLIAMQGPFSRELNVAMLRQISARFLVTKDTGREGGFAEKVEAAASCGCELVVIGRPEEEEGLSLPACLAMLAKRYAGIQAGTAGTPAEEAKDRDGDEAAQGSGREISLVGIGMGDPKGRTLTAEAARICREADLLIGAKRMLAAVEAGPRATLEEYRPEAIRDYIDAHPEFRRVAVLLSGDVGFFSGAKKLQQLLPGAKRVPGISSLVYFCSQLGTAWEDAHLVSAHGRAAHLVSEIRRHKKVFSLLNGAEDLRELCAALLSFGMEDIRLSYGADLGYGTERILRGTPAELSEEAGADLSVLLAENPRVDAQITASLPDEVFWRGQVPMTKEEVRAVSIGKLRLTEGAVLWDVGAGTGSVSVEVARLDPRATVYSIEKKDEAVELLRANRSRFGLDNMEVICGAAPEALADLPAPTHVFVGGSSGNLREILTVALEKNAAARIVINAITLETVSESLRAVEEFALEDVDVASVTVAKSRDVGKYHMMTGQNPVYVIAGGGKEREQ